MAEITIYDDKQELKLLVNLELLTQYEYFKAYFNSNMKQSPIKVDNIAIAKIVLADPTFVCPIENCRYYLEVIATQHYFGIPVTISSKLKVSKLDLEYFIKVCGEIGFDISTVKMLNKLIPIDYNFSELPNDLLNVMLKYSQESRLVLGHSQYINIRSLDGKLTKRIKQKWNKNNEVIVVNSGQTKIITTISETKIVVYNNIGDELAEFTNTDKIIYFLVSKDNKYLITLNNIGLVIIYDLLLLEFIREFQQFHCINSIALTSNNETIILCDQSGDIEIRNFNTFELIKSIKSKNISNTNVFTNDKYIITSQNHSIDIYDFAGILVNTISTSYYTIHSALLINGILIFNDGFKIRFYKLEILEWSPKTIDIKKKFIRFCISEDESTLAVDIGNQKIIVYDLINDTSKEIDVKEHVKSMAVIMVDTPLTIMLRTLSIN